MFKRILHQDYLLYSILPVGGACWGWGRVVGFFDIQGNGLSSISLFLCIVWAKGLESSGLGSLGCISGFPRLLREGPRFWLESPDTPK